LMLLFLPLECFFRDRIVGDGLRHCNPMSRD
jgi:hypothetical protein